MGWRSRGDFILYIYMNLSWSGAQIGPSIYDEVTAARRPPAGSRPSPWSRPPSALISSIHLFIFPIFITVHVAFLFILIYIDDWILPWKRKGRKR